MQIDPYLFFQGRAEEALNFYADALGARIEAIVRFGEMPGTDGPLAEARKVLHAAIRIGDTLVLASDGEGSGHANFAGFSLSLNARDDADARRLFDALAKGGEVRAPLGPTPFSSSFGMVADRFGVPWMVVVAPAAA